MDNGEILKRYEALYSERKGTIEQDWQQIDRYVVPGRSDFYSELGSEHEVERGRRELYDSTAPKGAKRLAARMHSDLTSSSQTWFEIRFRDEDLNERDDSKEWIDEVTNIIYSAINESNFNVEISEAYLDLTSYGTCVLIQELDDKTDKLNFTAIPVREIYFEEDDKKQVAKLYRRLQWTPLQIVSRFGRDNVPERIQKLADDASSSAQREDVIFAIYPREVSDDLDTSKPIAPKARPYAFKYILKNGALTIGEEGGFYEMPAYVTRWLKMAGTRWGKSPAIDAMGDILTLNKLVEATLEATGKAVDPATMSEAGNVIGDLDLRQGGHTTVTDIDGLRVIESGSNFQAGELSINRLVNSIREEFLQDKLELKDSPAMTATEANIRYELMQSALGSTFERIKTDLLDPLINRSFTILYRAGKLPEIPEGLDGANMEIEYSGPMARAQRNDAANAVKQYLRETAELAEIYPELLDLVDVDGAGRLVASSSGVPAKALRSVEEVEELRKSRAEQQQAMQQAQQAEQMGNAMGAIGEGGQAMAEVPPEMQQALASVGGG